MNMSIARLLMLAALVLPYGMAAAQPAASPTQPATTPAQPHAGAPAPWTPAWSTPEIQKVAQLLIGSWRSEPVTQAGSTPGSTEAPRVEIQMTVAPIRAKDLADTMYVEIARADAAWRPYRQAIFQLYTYKGAIRLRTYEIASTPRISPVLTGLWLAPELLPEVKRNDLIATIDVELKPAGAGFSGKSPYPYPTGAGGAVEMTSEISVTPDTFTSIDRGYDAAGQIVWGSADGDKYTFRRFTPEAKLVRLADGLIRIEYRVPSGDALKIEPSDAAAVHYIGWLYSNGVVFDTSRDRDPYVFAKGSVLPGLWGGAEGLTNGSVARLIIPPALAYGDKGAARSIPPNATLVYEIEVMDVQKRAPDALESGPAAGGPPPGQPPHSGPPAQPK